MTVKFTASDLEFRFIERIATRVVKMAKADGVAYAKKDVLMDIEATHCNGCRLDLEALLAAPASDFGHDVYGIRRFLDRGTGELTQLFLPRYALPAKAGRRG